jgi:hypothetical protein
MKKREAQFSTKCLPWCLRTFGTGLYEFKHTRGKMKFNMRELKQHQRDWLRAVQSPTGASYKIPDDGRSYKPGDGFAMKNEMSYVVIAYPEFFCVIDGLRLYDWKGMLSSEEAKNIAISTHKFNVL